MSRLSLSATGFVVLGETKKRLHGITSPGQAPLKNEQVSASHHNVNPDPVPGDAQ